MNLGKKLLQSREYYQQPFVEHDKIPRKTTKKTIAFYSLFRVSYQTSKVLPFGKMQINLHFRSLIRTFAPFYEL